MQIGWWGRREKSHSKINPCILSCFGTITQESEESEKLEGIQVKSTRMEGTLKFMRKERLGWLALFNQERTMGRGSGSFLFTDWWKENGGKGDSPFWKMHSERTSWSNCNLCWRLFQLDRRKLFQLQRSSGLEQDPWEGGHCPALMISKPWWMRPQEIWSTSRIRPSLTMMLD